MLFLKYKYTNNIQNAYFCNIINLKIRHKFNNMNKPFLTKVADKFIVFSLIFLCLAIFLPVFFKSLAITVFILSLVFTYCSKTYSLKENFTFNYFNLTLVGLYLFYVVGMFWSTDMKYGLFDLQVKLPILILPLLFLILPKRIMTKQTFWYCALVFIGAILISIICLYILGIIRTIANYSPLTDEITYTHLSPQITPSYMALYALIALILAYKAPISNLFALKSINEMIIKASIYIFLAIFVVLLKSRSGFISLLIVFVWIIADMFFVRKCRKQALTTLTALIIAMIAIFNIPFIYERYSGAIATKTQQSSSAQTQINSMSERTFIYSNAYKLILQKPFFGVGTGDTKQVLKSLYSKEDSNFDFYLNAHNQFLQTTISLGVLGLIVLLCAFAMPLKRCIKQKDYFVIAILCIIGIGFMFESMLERNIGVYPFAVIYSLITFYLVIDNQNYPTNSPKK